MHETHVSSFDFEQIKTRPLEGKSVYNIFFVNKKHSLNKSLEFLKKEPLDDVIR